MSENNIVYHFVLLHKLINNFNSIFLLLLFLFRSEDHQQLERLCKRNDFSEAVAKKRITCQMPLEDKVAKSHFVVDNSGSMANTRQQTECIIRLLRRSKFTW